MPVLHIGLASSVYSYGRRRSTKQVAEILEAKYALFSTFLDVCHQDIADFIGEEISYLIDPNLSSRVRASTTMADVGPKVEARFRRFITSYEAERVGIPSVPTKAAKKGIRHIGRHQISGRRRPSFRDSGLMIKNFRAWMTVK